MRARAEFDAMTGAARSVPSGSRGRRRGSEIVGPNRERFVLERAVTAIRTAALLAVVGLFVSTDGLAAQDCTLRGTEATRQAEQLIDETVQADSMPEQEAQSNYRQALTRIRLALKQNDEDAAAYWLAGRAHMGLGDYTAADSMLTRFTTLAPGCQEMANQARQSAWAEEFNAGIQAYQSGDQSTALEHFSSANVMKKDARSLNNAALLHQRAGDLEQAVELYQQSRKVATDPEQLQAATVNLAEVLASQGRIDQAMDIYSTYLSEHPGDVTATINYAVAVRRAAAADSGSTALADSAQRIFDQLLQRDDLSFSEWYNVGLGLIQSQSYEGAKVALEKAREILPYDKRTMESLVDVLRLTRNPGQAASIADTLVAWYPYQKDLYRAYIQTLDQQGRTQRVQQLLPQIQNLPVNFTQLDMTRQGASRYVIQGQVEPGTVGGQAVRIPFEFLNPAGEVVATKEVRIQVPAEGSASFQFVLESDARIVGFRHGEMAGGA